MKVLTAVFGLLLIGSASAHPLAPALLQLQASAPGEYEVLWRISTQGAARVGLAPELPSGCQALTPLRSTAEAGALATRWRVRCVPADLAGLRIAASGLPGSGANVIVRWQVWQRAPQQALLSVAQPAIVVAAPAGRGAVFADYLHLGIAHLLSGYDHLLFISGLVLLVRRLRPLLATVTAFTVGHSATLSLAALGIVHFDPRLTEFGIALSILLLATELARPRTAGASRWARRPWLMAAAFGLLHGLGFAGALTRIGLPQQEIPLSLLAFNLGIELGQIAVVLLLLSLALGLRLLRRALPARMPADAAPLLQLPAYAIGVAAAYWCWARAAQLLMA